MENLNETAYPIFARNFSQIIGYKVKADRKARSAAAKLLDVKYESVRGWTEGLYLPKGETLLKIKEIYEVDIDWLLTGQKGQSFPPPQWDRESIDACHMVHKILTSDNDKAKDALRTNLAVFEDHDNLRNNNHRIDALEKEISVLKELYNPKIESGT